MNSPSSLAAPRVLFESELAQDAVTVRDLPIRTKEVFHRKPGEDFCKRNVSFTAQAAIPQVFPRCQPAIL